MFVLLHRWTGGAPVASAIGAIALLASFSVSEVALAQDGSSPVGVDKVTMQPLSQTVPVLGRLVAVQRGTVAALTRGPVLEVHVNVGDLVYEGDTLITQAMDRLERSRDAAETSVGMALAAVATAQSELDLADQELASLDKLLGSAAFSAAQFEDKAHEVAVRRAEVTEARSEVARARALLAEAQLDVDLGIIRAPFNGGVVEKHTVRGAYMSVGDPAITLINDEDLEIEADVPANRVSALTLGRTVSVDFGAGQESDAVVRAVVPEENALTRTRLVRFLLNFGDQPGLLPAAGQSVSVLLPVGQARDVVAVHKDAVLARGRQAVVFVVQEDMTVQIRPIQIGESVGSRFEVLSGLSLGETVVVRGNERLQPGQAVTWPSALTPESSDSGNEAARSGSSG